jgi:hypothetical protein
MEMKQCSKCNEVKPFDQFNKDRRAKDNLQSQCRKCSNADSAAYAPLRRARNRKLVFAHYGETCAYDNADCSGGLEIDHRDGNGDTHRTEIFGARCGGTPMYQWLVKNNFPEGFQTLCRYHNHAKRNTPDAEYRRKLGLAA